MTLLTAAETATKLRTTVNTLAKWRCIGRYPKLSNAIDKGGAVVKRGRSVFYSAAAVEEFVAAAEQVG